MNNFNYYVVSVRDDKDIFVNEVQWYLDEGYELVGGVSVSHDNYRGTIWAQAVRREKINE